MKIWFPSDKAPGTSEPLVVTGAMGKGDVLFVRYVDDRLIAIGFDHWNVGGPTSAPFEINYADPHRLAVRMGSLFPPAVGPLPQDRRRRLLEVKLDGVVVLSGAFEFYDAPASQVYIGRNPIGASTADLRFSGRITDVWRGE